MTVVEKDLNTQAKAIFLCGMPFSGKSLLGNLLNCHPGLIFVDSHSKFIADPVFQQFPDWFLRAPEDCRKDFVRVFKTLCLTRYYCFYRDSLLHKPFLRVWEKLDRFWQTRFQDPQSWFWKSFLGAWFESFWLQAVIQARAWGFKLKKGIPMFRRRDWKRKRRKSSPAGLHHCFSETEVRSSLEELDALLPARTKTEVLLVLGKWWNRLYCSYAHKYGKEFWMDEKPDYLTYSEFLIRGFEDPKIIHLVRDPRHQAFLMMEQAVRAIQREHPQNRIDEALKFQLWKDYFERWVAKTAEGLPALQSLSDSQLLVIRYEDLIAEPAETLLRSLIFLSIPETVYPFEEASRIEKEESQSINLSAAMKKYAVQNHKTMLELFGYDL